MNTSRKLRLALFVGITIGVADGAQATLINLGDGAFSPVKTINFGEYPLGTLNPSYSYTGLPKVGDVTVSFAGKFNGQVAATGIPVTLVDHTPTGPLALDHTGPSVFTAHDLSSTTNPVLSGNPTFNGPISVQFSSPVAAVGLKGGYFDAIGGTTIEAYSADGSVLGSIKNSSTGFEFYGLKDSSGANKISGISFFITGPEPAGFGIDNLTFGFANPVPTIGTLSGPASTTAGAPTVVITHGWNGSTESWVDEMQSAMTRPDAVKVGNAYTFKWPDADTGFDLPSALQSALASVKNAGYELGKDLFKLGEDKLEHLHFVGHSLGTLVNAYAVDYLTKRGVNVEQFTILDRPLGNGTGGVLLGNPPLDLDEEIFQHLLPKNKVKWVDNYYGTGVTATGDAFQNAIAFNKPLKDLEHSQTHDWYTCTVGGGGGSGLSFAPDYFGCNSFGDPAYGSGGYGYPVSPDWDPGHTILASVSEILKFDPVLWAYTNCELQMAGTGVKCTEGSPAYLWNNEFTIPEDAEYMSFDFLWNKLGDGDFLTAQFGDQLLFKFLGSDFDDSDFISSGLIPLIGLNGMTDQLLFTLNSVGEPNAQFSIRNLAFFTRSDRETGAVPEPGTVALLLLGSILLAYVRTNRHSLSRPRSTITSQYDFYGRPV